jgi:cytoskeletal protein CcmA (bactofilin family)
MGVKNNFSQAVSELMGLSRSTENSAENLKTQEQKPVEEETEMDLEGTEEQENDAEDHLISAESTLAEAEKILEAQEEKTEVKHDPPAATAANPNKEKILAMLAQQQQQQVQQSYPQQNLQSQQQAQTLQQAQQNLQPKQAPGKTTIARGTVIIGEIKAEGDVELLGSVKGKVSSQGDILVNGKVVGDLMGKDIELTACAVQGNIIASGMVSVDGDSVVIGDVKGENFCLDGKIKGNVIVEKEAKFQPKAILSGNVTTASIAMSQGAKIQGEVNIPLNEKENDLTFDVDITI